MKKTFAALAVMTSLNAAAQTYQKDTLRNIELPAAIIKEVKQKLQDEKQPKRLDKNVIKRLNQGQDIPFLLNSISSVVTSSDAGTGTGYTGIRIRGTDLTRINVTLNGVPVNDPESQATYFVNTPDLLSSSQNIEVSKGVGISKNGVGNFGAGISINNLDVNQEKPALSYSTDYGSFQTFRNTLKVSSGLINEKFVATMRASTINSDGYIDRSSSALRALQFSGKYIVSPSTQLVFNYMKGHEKTGQAWNGVPQDSLQTNRTYNELGMRSDGTFYPNQTDNYGQDYYQLFADHKLSNKFSIGTTLFYTRGKGYYEEYKTSQSFSDYGLSDFIAGTDTFSSTDLIRQLWLDNHFYGGRAYLNYSSKQVDAGLYLNFNQYDGKHYGDVKWAQYGIADNHRWYNLTAYKTDINLYGMVDYRILPNLSLFADLQYRRVDYTLNGFRRNPGIFHDLQFDFFNPKIKITYKNNQHLISLLGGIAQKEPNRDDIEAGVSSLPRPEKLYNAELNYIFNIKNNFAFYATGFLMYYRDQLVLTGKINDVGAYTRTNIPESYRIGLELEAQWKSPNKHFEFAANLALSENKVVNFEEYIDDYDLGGQKVNQYNKTDIAFSPSVVAGGRLSFFPFRNGMEPLLKNASLDVLPKYVSRQYLDNTQQLSRSINPYSTTDAIINFPFALNEKSNLTLRTGIYNVFNSLYEANGYTFSYIYNQNLTTQNYFYPQAGRRWMIGIGIDL